MAPETITISIEDMAEQLASAEDAGFTRALHAANLPDRTRMEMQQEHNHMHGLRVRLYTAKMRLAGAA